MGALRRTLPALNLSEAEFVGWAVKNVKDRPGNYREIVRINAGGASVDADASALEVGPNRCAIA